MSADISRWFDEGVDKKATHMIVVCDTFDWEDYPVYVMPGQDAKAVADKYASGDNMQRLMEVYDLKLSKAAQLGEARSFHY